MWVISEGERPEREIWVIWTFMDWVLLRAYEWEELFNTILGEGVGISGIGPLPSFYCPFMVSLRTVMVWLVLSFKDVCKRDLLVLSVSDG